MMEVILWDMCDAGLIVPQATGVHYSNQVGGTACFQRSQEGIFIPINHDILLGDYDASIEAKLTKVFHDVGSVKVLQADQIDLVLEGSGFTKGIAVDRGRLSDSCEAWVYVDVVETDLSAFKGFGKFKAILTWPNSD
jgi:hypothetical protein